MYTVYETCARYVFSLLYIRYPLYSHKLLRAYWCDLDLCRLVGFMRHIKQANKYH